MSKPVARAITKNRSDLDLPFAIPTDDTLEARLARLPSTRYQGSKAKLLPLLTKVFGELSFDSALDLFSGTASVAYALKAMGKRVHANDALTANKFVADALVVNEATTMSLGRARSLFSRDPSATYDDFIARTFQGVFFLDEENAWLDVVSQNIARLDLGAERALASYALFQACLKKRPFNLFHRKNLELRTRSVVRSFGNKATWEADFARHFEEALDEANRAVFASGRAHTTSARDAVDVEATADLVYLDPPYMNARDQSVNYLDHYHFLEGLTELDAWGAKIDRTRAHLPYARVASPWLKATTIRSAFEALFEKHRASIFVVSYRADGIPTAVEIASMLERVGKRVKVHRADHRYALSTRATTELVFVAE